MKINEALKNALPYLNSRKYTNPLYESRLILSYILDKDVSFLYAYGDLDLNKDQEKDFFKILERRKNGEPLQYIFGYTYFMTEKFLIYRGVLIPRSDTENSVETIVNKIKKNRLKSFLEIGCGSGVVSIMVNLLTNIKTCAVDISELAIKNTLINARQLNAEIEVFKSNLFENVKGKYDIIYSNPPYIPTCEIKNLQEEVKNFEPLEALDGGNDGLKFYRSIVNEVSNFLTDKGYLIFEIGFDQKEKIKELMQDNFDVSFKKDLHGFYRVAIGKRRC